jgi:hypothetical protein
VKRRKQATEEQKAARAARMERFKQIAEKVSQMTAEQRQAIVDKYQAIVTCEGRPLSPFNTCLLISQAEGLSMVGGLRQWNRAGRVVNKGSQALMIWAPLKQKDEPDLTAAPDDDDRQRFIPVYVFDITQTSKMESKEDAPATSGKRVSRGQEAKTC